MRLTDAEIEQLRNERNDLLTEVGRLTAITVLDKAEIERLQAVNLKQSLDVVEKFEQKDAEIKRLRAALGIIADANNARPDVPHSTVREFQIIARCALEDKP
jgi:hypothetical protein